MDIQARGKIQKRVGRGTGYALLIITSLILIAPVIFMVISSFKDDSEYLTYPIRVFPEVWKFSNYGEVFELTPFAEIALRTGLLAISTAVITAIISSMVGYAFARFQVPGSNALFVIVIAMLIVPFIVILIPQFMIYARLKLTNTYWPWILAALGGTPFYIFLFRQFFLGFPKELEEAAEVDGCGPFRIYWQIFLPNSKPVFATVMIFAIVAVWDSLDLLEREQNALGCGSGEGLQESPGLRPQNGQPGCQYTLHHPLDHRVLLRPEIYPQRCGYVWFEGLNSQLY
jgi:ABC-type glycerol-3-phosphate transport system permease component